MKTKTSSLMDSNLVDFSNKNSHLIKSNSTTSSHTDREYALFLRWILKHYSTKVTDKGMFGWVDSMNREVSIQDIVLHYRNEFE